MCWTSSGSRRSSADEIQPDARCFLSLCRITEFFLEPFIFLLPIRAYRKAGYLTMVIADYIPANSQLAAAIAIIVKSLSIGK